MVLTCEALLYMRDGESVKVQKKGSHILITSLILVLWLMGEQSIVAYIERFHFYMHNNKAIHGV